ncbi:MAG TPA: efflux RND transporter periplasmic adaptor subunit [Blastocatellia bacterium]|nr:efflux RND transporter periplasmic adaptor subunit [Blastocatellia bacterium]
MSATPKVARKRRRWIIATIVLLLLAGTAIVAASAFKTETTIDPSKLETVDRGDIARSVVATGKIEPLTKVEVKSKASGLVKSVHVDYGESVRRGQVLAELDKEQLQATLREQRASLESAQAVLLTAKASVERGVVDASNPDLPFLKSNLDRSKKLYDRGIISTTDLENAEKAYQIALNKQLSAQRGVAVTQADVERARAEVARAQASVERAEEDLRNSTITSPIDGVVLSRDVEPGDAVSSILVLGSQATLVCTLGDTSQLYVKGKVDEADIGKVYDGQPARITVESFKDKKFNGTVHMISPLGAEKDNVTTFEVRVTIDDPGNELKANMSANAEIILEEKKGVLLIPESSVIYDKERNTFAELPDKTAEGGRNKIPIKVGISNGVKTEVVEGLNEGQQVILQ